MHKVLFAVFLALCTTAQAQSLFTFSAKPGEHGVGLRYVRQYDTTRAPMPRTGASGRPIQTVIWYPAAKGGASVKYDDYLKLLGWETNFTLSPPDQKKLVDAWIAMVTEGKRPAQVEAVRNTTMWAVMDAAPAKGSFPVVIYAPSINNTAFENADLAEYLASHGYIVITSPTIGASTRYIRRTATDAEHQVGDIGFLIDYAKTLPQADMARVAVAGFSWGGLTNVLAASKDDRIKALVSMDGAGRYYNELITKAGYAAPEKLKTPMLFLAQSPQSLETHIREKQDMSGSFLNAMSKAPVHILTMYPMDHVHFGASFIRFDDGADYKEYTPAEVSHAYSIGALYTLNFLDGYLKSRPDGLAFLARRPVDNGAHPHSMVMDYRPAK
jgi:dienelactone hydrolase